MDSDSSWVLDPVPCLFAFLYFFRSPALSFLDFVEAGSQMPAEEDSQGPARLFSDLSC